jgi:signal peptide peptidase SppA
VAAKRWRYRQGAVSLSDYLKFLPIERFRNPPPLVTVLRFDGVIGPRQWRGAVSLASHAAALEKAFAAKRLAAVALAVNSPGGSPVQSALLFRRIRQLADEKHVPVFAFAEDVAASGGYWLALAGDEIYAEEASLIGSIGVVTSGFGFTRLIDRLGIDRRLYTAGENKSLLDPFLPEREADVERLTTLQHDIHAAFKEQVLRRRVGKIGTADETLFSGEVLTGRMALSRGLIDGIGDLRAVMRARFGDRVRLVPIASERRRRWFLPRPRRGIESEGIGLLADLVNWLEARLLWARFGL